MKTFYFVLGAVLGMSMMGCSNDEPSENGQIDNTYERITLSRGEEQVANAGCDFAWNLMDKMNEETTGENVCLSPVSANIALTMLLNGASGNTYDEIAGVLGLQDMSLEEINENSAFLVTTLLNRDKYCTISCANSLWIDNSFPVKDSYVSTLSKYFDAKAANTDASHFASDVNSWCNEYTNGLVPKVIEDNKNYTWALLNAIYYQNIWSDNVKFSSAGDMDFKNFDNSVSSTPFMKTTKNTCKHAETEVARHAHIPFGNGAYYMSISLPNEGVSLEQCIAELKSGSLDLINGQNIGLTMPKLELNVQYRLDDVLKSLGIIDAYDSEKAEFPNISNNNTFVDIIRQGSYFKLDEKGATAAAVTVIPGAMAAYIPEYIEPMVVDRPFIFTIYETSTKCILFMGKIEKL